MNLALIIILTHFTPKVKVGLLLLDCCLVTGSSAIELYAVVDIIKHYHKTSHCEYEKQHSSYEGHLEVDL